MRKPNTYEGPTPAYGSDDGIDYGSYTGGSASDGFAGWRPTIPGSIPSWENASSMGEPSRLQPLVDALFADKPFAKQMDLILLADAFDLDDDLLEVVGLLPPGFYLREEMCDQLNSIITAHGWGMTVGTVS